MGWCVTTPVFHEWPKAEVSLINMAVARDWLHAHGCHNWNDQYPDQPSYKWAYGRRGDNVIAVFRIHDPQIALRFKLTWGGV
jgi:hypothetical protein